MPRRFIAVLLPLLAAAGCMSWHAQSSPAPEVVARQQGRGSVRVLRCDGSVLVLQTPEFRDDSIVGVGGNPPRRTGVALADVERIDARRFSATRTGGLVLAYFAIISLLAVGAALGAWAAGGVD